MTNKAGKKEILKKEQPPLFNTVKRAISKRTNNNGKKKKPQDLSIEYKGAIAKEKIKKDNKKAIIQGKLENIFSQCSKATKKLRATEMNFSQNGEAKKEAYYFNLFETRLLRKRAMKMTILEDVIKEFYTSMRHVKYAYRSAINNASLSPLEATKLLVSKTTLPYVKTEKQAFEAVYIAKEIYGEEIIIPYWDKQQVDENEASLVAGSIYYATLLEGKNANEAFNEVRKALQEEYGHAINYNTTMEYICNTVYNKFRPKKSSKTQF